jgi:hypothetical protein
VDRAGFVRQCFIDGLELAINVLSDAAIVAGVVLAAPYVGAAVTATGGILAVTSAATPVVVGSVFVRSGLQVAARGAPALISSQPQAAGLVGGSAFVAGELGGVTGSVVSGLQAGGSFGNFVSALVPFKRTWGSLRAFGACL